MFFILKKFVFGNVIKAIEDRRKTIEDTEKEQELVKQEIQDAKIKAQEIITSARNESSSLIENAKKEATETANEIRDKSMKAITDEMHQAKESISNEKDKILSGIKRESIDAIVNSVEKIIKSKIDPQKDLEIIKLSLDEINEQRGNN